MPAPKFFNESPEGVARFVAAYLIARTFVWTALLYLTQPALNIDVLEHLAWGREWRIIYWKHPGLNAWISESINILTGGSRLALLAAAPVCSTLAMWAAWLLARKILDAKRAAVAALSLEGVYYFNASLPEFYFNHNVLQLAACAWLVYFAHKAFFGGGKPAWFFLGIAAAVSLYAKYSSALFLAVLFYWSVAEPAARKQWKTAGPALAFLVFAALTVPQIIALMEVRFAPFQFAINRAEEARVWTDHIVHPARFAAAQLAACFLGAALCLWATKKPAAAPAASAARRFLFAAAFGPLLLTLAVSALGGLELRSLWGTAMVSFIPLWILSWRGELNFARWKKSLFAVAALALVAATAINFGAPFWNGRGKRVHYPAAAIAQKVEAEWRARHPDAPLRYVIGGQHISSIISFYSEQRPAAVMYNADWTKSFDASKEDFAKSGGVVAWIIYRGKNKPVQTPPPFAEEYLTAGDAAEFSFAWDTPAKIPPLVLGFVFVPPAN